MKTEYFVLTRAIHFGACLLFFGLFAFYYLVAVPIFSGKNSEVMRAEKARLKNFNLILLPLIFLSGLAWLVLVSLTMSGKSLTLEILKTVWTQTQFGTLWEIRLIIWFVATAIVFFIFLFNQQESFQKILLWLQFFCAGALLGSLAWTGHGQLDSRWHLSADILHLLIAGFWPLGLLPLILILRRLNSDFAPAQSQLIISLIRRFSLLSLISVVLLTLTGWVNAWYLVGSFANLFGQTYGRWLLGKIIFFGCAVFLGAINSQRLAPRMISPTNFDAAAIHLRRNVWIELSLATAIIIIVAILGILPPAQH